MKYALGRDPAPDPRDAAYRVADHVELPKQPPRKGASGMRRKYHYANGLWRDQGEVPSCVGHAWMHWFEDGPVTHEDRAAGAAPLLEPDFVYREAQKVDEWDGEDYEGTSVRAGAKVLQARGLIGPYLWARTLDDALSAIALQPVVVGSWWYDSMFEPEKSSGMLRIEGEVAGGHAYVANGASWDRRVVRIKNSWGRGWGRDGHAFVSFDDFERLIAEDGEVCYAEEIAA